LARLSTEASVEFHKWIEQARKQAYSMPPPNVPNAELVIPEPSASQFIDDESLIKIYDDAFGQQNHKLPPIVPDPSLSQQIDDNCLMEAYDEVMKDTL
jgi:hypothetical protein